MRVSNTRNPRARAQTQVTSGGHGGPRGRRLRLLPRAVRAVKADSETRDGMERGRRRHRRDTVRRTHARTIL